MTVTDTDTIATDAALEELATAEALRELAEENADLRDELADSRRSLTIVIRVLGDLISQLHPDGITATAGSEDEAAQASQN